MQTNRALAPAVGKFLRQKGYALSDPVGHRISRRICPKMWAIGILKTRIQQPLPSDGRYPMIAIVDFFSFNCVSGEGHWVLSILGLPQSCELKKLAEEMAKHFGVSVETKLFCSDKELMSIRCQETAG